MSLKSIIVDAYSIILEIILWLVLVICAGAGFYFGKDLGSSGWILGIVLGIVGGFIIDAVVFGALALLLDIRNKLKEITQKNG